METRNKQSILQLYDTILPVLAQHINRNITPVAALFDDFGLERLIDTWTRDPAANDSEEISVDKGNVQQIGLKLRLHGFKSAGAGAFDMSRDLLFRLDRNSYTVGPDKDTVWLEKDYQQRWQESEYEEVATKWTEELIDALTERIENLSK